MEGRLQVEEGHRPGSQVEELLQGIACWAAGLREEEMGGFLEVGKACR